MMRYKNYIVLLKTLPVLMCIVIAVSSCNREEFRFTYGESVRFTAATCGSSVATRAEYSGVSSGKLERIDWQDGDLIRIWCNEASEPVSKWADYVINEGTVTDAGALSKARISVVEGIGLRWGEPNTDHVFYAVYPSPASVSGTVFPGSGTATSMTCIIPAVQTPLSLNAAAESSIPHFTAVPDLGSEYMVATNTISSGSDTDVSLDGETVFLQFKPIVTAIEFTITNDFAEDTEHPENEVLNISNIQLLSGSYDIAGTFMADLTDLSSDGSTYPSSTSTQDGKTVTMDFSNIPDYDYSGNAAVDGSRNYVRVARGETLRFTYFLKPLYKDGAPVDVDDLTFKIVKADGSWVSTKLAYNDAEKTGVPFPCHKKSYVTGILVPEGAQWTVKYAPSVNPWVDETPDPVDPEPEISPEPLVTTWTTGYTRDNNMLKYNYELGLRGPLEFLHEGTTNTALFPTGKSVLTITSCREYNHNSTPVIWHLEYWDEESGEWTMARSNELIGGLVTLDPVVGDGENADMEFYGDNDFNVTVVASDAPASLTHDARLRTADDKGTESAPYDLSMHDIYGNPRPSGKPVTANCYVIDAPGWYAFPMVYGNGVDYHAAPGGGTNTVAFNPGGETDNTSTFLSKFYNAYGNPMLSAFIEDDTSEATGEWSAFPLWQDVAGDAILADNSCTVLSVDAAASKGLNACNCGYVMFNVSDETLTQGNVVLALKKGDTVVWSWHLWVTDNDLTCSTVTTSSDEGRIPMGMLPLDLGWVDDDAAASNYYDGASVKLRAVQNGSTTTMEFSITRIAETEVTHTEGSSPYWQWGRKDPFIRQCANSTVHSGYGSAFSFESASQPIDYSIRNPHVFISQSNTWYNDADASYRNLWSMMNNMDGTDALGYAGKQKKTVYDPCPPGFVVPQGNAFTGLDLTMANVFLSKSGFRDASSSGATSQVGTNGYYWTAVPSSSSSHWGISMNFNGAINSVTPAGFKIACKCQ